MVLCSVVVVVAGTRAFDNPWKLLYFLQQTQKKGLEACKIFR